MTDHNDFLGAALNAGLVSVSITPEPTRIK
jgi:hypothetical protein